MTKTAEEKNFKLKFIKNYRCLPALWNTKLEAYSNREEKKKQYNILFRVYKEQYPSATLEEMKRKINSLRSNYQREKGRIGDCKRTGSEANNGLEPSLFYFKEMQFLDFAEKPTPYSSTVSSINNDTAKHRKRKQNASEALIEIATKHFASKNKKNPTEIITDSWGVKLDRMEPKQRILCEKFIEDILFEGQMGTLHSKAVFVNESSSFSIPQQHFNSSTAVIEVNKVESISPTSSMS